MIRSLDAEIANETVDRMEKLGFWLYDERIRDKVGPLTNYVDWINLAAAVRRMNKAPNSGPDLTPQIACEIYIAMEGLAADAQLLGILGSWRNTMTDEEVLADLKSFNQTGSIFDGKL